MNEFIEEFGDVYDMSELDVNAAVDVSSDDTYTLTATNDDMPSRLELDFNRMSGDTVGECIVESVDLNSHDVFNAEKRGELDSFNFWAPYGIKLHPDDLTTSDIEEICKAEGLKEYITGSGEKHFYNCYFINSFNDLEIEVVSKEKCKNGYYPVITYRFKCKSKYNKDENVLYLSSCACVEYLTEEEAAEYNK